MSNRFVRSSKFRHVFGTTPKREHCYDSIRTSNNPNESNMCSVSAKFLAVALEGAGGGSFLICPLSKVGRFDINYPKVTGHGSPVTDLAWNPFNDNQLASCGEDGYVRLWNFEDAGIKEDMSKDQAVCELAGHMKKVMQLAWHPSAEDILVSVGGDHLVIVWDTKAKEIISKISVHTQQVYSVSWSYNGAFIATSSKDKKIRVIDPRSGEVMQEGKSHEGTKPCRVIFCGTTNRIFSTGFSRMSERQIALWDPTNLGKPLTITNLDSASGVLFPFWDEGTKMVYTIGKGETCCKYFEVTDDSPYIFYLSTFLYPSNSPSNKIPQRSAAPMYKRELDYMSCEVMRFYKVLPTKGQSGCVEPMSMTVPRKSDMFQDDIYPPCPSGKPALSAEEWRQGTNKDPLLLKFSQEGLSELPEAESQISTPIKFSSGSEEKCAPSVHKRLGSPQPGDPNARPTPVTLSEYKDAYKELLAENEKLKKKIAQLEGK